MDVILTGLLLVFNFLQNVFAPCVQNFERAADPGKAVLDEWMRHPEFDPTLGHLVKLLAELGREDILTDCKEMIGEVPSQLLSKPGMGILRIFPHLRIFFWLPMDDFEWPHINIKVIACNLDPSRVGVK